MITAAIEYAKTAAAALGVGGVLFSAYATAGLPIPASQEFVEAKVGAVVDRINESDVVMGKKIDVLSATTLELQRKSIVQQRARLRYEFGANTALATKADAVRRVALERRAAEISDELAELDRDDVDLRARIDKLRQP
ncbi:hypothetical protein [Methylobacterium gossipiicola]|uniref:Uncharacterized protein n=1 Tax=Methylobacterium gossipiicola TaxID=582675 RepID=A0A1I2VG31_9HYPH|nr:hypothetical protein [Methylobacterium gossipiicola]SFG88248.1 hypothetical protein SAMN05192565_1156 [Methylobacterium gossipiicola]